MKLQLKRSSTLVSGNAKPPLASQLDFGEIAINYNTTDPKLFFKDSAGNVLGLTDNYLQLRGGTLTGDLVLNGDPTSALMPATKQYTDTAITNLSNSITYPVTSVNGSTGAVSLNYSSVGAPSVTGTSATGTWGISITGNSATATSLATARSISLSGDVSGSATFNGTSNITITATVADDSHNHVIANVDGLQTALNAKQYANTAISNSLALNGKADTAFVQTAYNSSLNSDSRNSRGVTRLYRRDNDSDYSVQTHWTGTRWRVDGYNGDTYHAGAEVAHADTSTTSTNVDILADNSTNSSRYLLFASSASGSTRARSDNGLTYNPSNNTLNSGSVSTTAVYLYAASATTPKITNSSNYSLDIELGTQSNTSYIALKQSTAYRAHINYNSAGQVGFGGLGGAWLAYSDSSGNWTATGDVTAYSDRSLKTDIQPIKQALNKVDQINGVTFERIDKAPGVRHAGVIAQDVQKVLPEVVREDAEGKLTVAYGNIVGLLVEAIKELRQEVKELKGE